MYTPEIPLRPGLLSQSIYSSQGPGHHLSAVKKFLHSLESGQASQPLCCLSLESLHSIRGSQECSQKLSAQPESLPSWSVPRSCLERSSWRLQGESLWASRESWKALFVQESWLASKSCYLNRDVFISTLRTLKVPPVRSQYMHDFCRWNKSLCIEVTFSVIS